MAKSELRIKARERWGKDWHKCHPLIKKARLAWCEVVVNGYHYHHPQGDRVHVHEGGCSYVV